MLFRLRHGRRFRSGGTVSEERHLLEVLLDSMEVAVVACAMDGRLIYANTRAREIVGIDSDLGSEPATWIEKSRLRTAAGAAFHQNDLPLMRALDGLEVRGLDVLARGGSGDVLLNANAYPMVDDEGLRLGAVVVFDDVTGQRARDARIRRELRDAGMALDVQAAIDAGHLELFSQPIVDILSGETVLEELLLRMRSPDGTISAPGDFLAAAERNETIVDVDAWVFGQAAKIAAGGRPVTVNVSARTVSSPSFLQVVEEALAENEADPSLITLEITETAVVSDIVQVSRFADRINEIGCQVALDDFGTGFAALTYLKHLRVRYLKIDVDFVRDLAENPRSRSVVTGVVALAASLNHKTIAEGVESFATLDLLSELGVDLVQGFGVGEPAPIA